MRRDQPEQPTETVPAQLLIELQRYLAVVEAWRAYGIEPTWADDESLLEWWLAEHLPDTPTRRAK